MGTCDVEAGFVYYVNVCFVAKKQNANPRNYTFVIIWEKHTLCKIRNNPGYPTPKQCRWRLLLSEVDIKRVGSCDIYCHTAKMAGSSSLSLNRLIFIQSLHCITVNFYVLGLHTTKFKNFLSIFSSKILRGKYECPVKYLFDLVLRKFTISLFYEQLEAFFKNQE